MAQSGSQNVDNAHSPTTIVNTDDINFRTINIDNNGQQNLANQQSGAAADLRMETTSNFQRRTAEGSRILRNNIHLVFEEIRPYVEQARSNLLNRQNSQSTPPTITNNPIPIPPPLPPATASSSDVAMNTSSTSNNDAFVISVDNGAQSPDSPSSEARAEISPPSPSHNNNNGDDVTSDALRHMPETRTLLLTLKKYLIVVIILSAKAIYDHHEGILMLMSLFITFSHANSVFKQEVMKQGRRSIASLLVVLMYIALCIFFLDYIFNQKLYGNLVFAAEYTNTITVSTLLWSVTVSDFMLKLITVVCKIFVIFVPGFIMPFQRRGKIYLLLESISQFYRSLLPIQPWLWFLLNSYQGAERVLGVLLAAVYMVAKGADLASKLKLIKTAIYKLLQSVNFATAATKEQLRTAGEQCAICHDMFNGPVALQPCKHVFCETCVCAWLDRERTCPLCRALVSDDPEWRDGSTAHFIQIY